MLFSPLIHVKMPTIVGILTFMSGENFMLNSVEHEKSFIISGPGLLAILSPEWLPTLLFVLFYNLIRKRIEIDFSVVSTLRMTT